MIKKIKHGTTVMRESMRKHEGPLALRDDFAPAAEQFKSMQQTIAVFIEDAQNILKVLPSLSKTASTFSANAAQALATLPESEHAFAARLTSMTDALASFTERQADESADAVLQPLRDLLAQVNELAAVQTDQRNSFLILESNKAKLETFQKDPEKNALKIEQYIEKIRVRTGIVQSLEEEFIGRMNAIWENRFDVLNRPLMALMGVILQLGTLARSEADAFAELLGPELVEAEYRSAQVPEKGKK
jgi:hypothetical protein